MRIELSLINDYFHKIKFRESCPKQLEWKDTNKLNNSSLSCQGSDWKKYSERSDVVFKSIFRSIKKYYLNEFKAHWDRHSIVVNKKNKKDALDKIWVFVEKLFAESKLSSQFDKIETLLMAKYIALISLPDYVIKSLGDYKVRRDVGLFYQWIYQFSFAKLKRLFESPEIQLLFSHFIFAGGLQKMIEMDKNIQKLKDIVVEKTRELFQWYIERSKDSLD